MTEPQPTQPSEAAPAVTPPAVLFFEGPIEEMARAFEIAADVMLNLLLLFTGGKRSYDEVEAGLDEVAVALAEDGAEWAEDVLPEVYASGVRAAMGHENTPDVDPNELADRVHDDSLEIFIDELISQIEKATGNISEDAKASLREAGRERLAASLDNGTNARVEARKLDAQMRERGINFVDRRGRAWKPRAYAEMLLRTHTIEVSNEANLNTAAELGAPGVAVFDGGPGDVDLPCTIANGQNWSLRYARRHRTEHPNCRRAFAPLPSTFNPDELDKKDSDDDSPEDEARREQERIERERKEQERRDRVSRRIEEKRLERERREAEEEAARLEAGAKRIAAIQAQRLMNPDDVEISGVESESRAEDLRERSALVHNYLLGKYPYLANRWSGIMAVEDQDEMDGAYAYKSWECYIAMSTEAELRITARYETLLHEMFHAVSVHDASSPENYRRNPGWEEAVVEMQNRLNIRGFLEYMKQNSNPEGKTGFLLDDADQIDRMVNQMGKERFAYHPYNRFIRPLEQLRETLGEDPVEFYDELLAVEQAKRGTVIRKKIMEKWPNKGREQTFALDLLRVTNQAMMRRG